MKTSTIVAITLLFFLSCTTENKKSQDDSGSLLFVSVVNYPLYYFAKSIGGEHVNVYLPALGGEPAYWKPEARQVINFQKSDLIFINGAGYAKWIEKVSLPSSKIINTSRDFKDEWIETDEEVVHSHGSEGEHSHKGTAFTTWLNFSFASLHAQAIYEELARLLPDHKIELKKNYETLNMSLNELDDKAQQTFGDLKGHKIITSHPIYQYLSSAYGIEMINMHWETDEIPTAGMWNDLEKTIEDHDAYIMLWEGEPIDEVKSRLQGMNIKISVFDPCANKPEDGNFIDVMRSNLTKLDVSINSQLP